MNYRYFWLIGYQRCVNLTTYWIFWLEYSCAIHLLLKSTAILEHPTESMTKKKDIPKVYGKRWPTERRQFNCSLPIRLRSVILLPYCVVEARNCCIMTANNHFLSLVTLVWEVRLFFAHERCALWRFNNVIVPCRGKGRRTTIPACIRGIIFLVGG